MVQQYADAVLPARRALAEYCRENLRYLLAEPLGDSYWFPLGEIDNRPTNANKGGADIDEMRDTFGLPHTKWRYHMSVDFDVNGGRIFANCRTGGADLVYAIPLEDVPFEYFSEHDLVGAAGYIERALRKESEEQLAWAGG